MMRGFEFEHRQPQEEGGYNVFRNEYVRHDIFEFSKELATYVAENEIKSIIFLDRSARPAWIGFNEYWKMNYSDKPKPSINFINPEAFDPLHPMYHQEEKEPQGIVLVTKDGEIRELDRIKQATREIQTKFEDVFNRLVDRKDEPTLIFDTCSHSGGTIEDVTSALRSIGFSDLRVITANRPDDKSGVKADAFIDNNTYLTSCYPFGKWSAVDKGDDIISEASPYSGSTTRFVREEIKRIIHDQGK